MRAGSRTRSYGSPIVIATLAAAWLAAFSAAPAQVDAGEIVVTARKRLREWRATMRMGGKGYGCRTRKSSGDPEIDAIACRAMARCMTSLKPRMDATAASKPPRSERAAINRAFSKEAGDCFQKDYEAAVAELDARRDAARE